MKIASTEEGANLIGREDEAVPRDVAAPSTPDAALSIGRENKLVPREVLKAIAGSLKSANRIVLLPHQNVDGDALGAALALGLGLEACGKQVDILLEEAVPKMLDFLPGMHLIKKAPAKQYDVAMNIDNGDLARLGVRLPVFQYAAVRLSIDHHSTNHVEADYSFVDTAAAATGEIVGDLLKLLEIPYTGDIAICLYTAILTDTGGFRFTNTTSETHRFASELMSYGIDCGYIAKRVFDTVSLAKLQLIKLVMNRLQFYEDGQLAISWLKPDEIMVAGGTSDDFEGMVNIGRNVEGVEVSLFIREEEDKQLKGSLRSNECVDVAKVAEAYGGGGHKRAAGFSLKADLDGTMDKLKKDIIEAIRDCQSKSGF